MKQRLGFGYSLGVSLGVAVLFPPLIIIMSLISIVSAITCPLAVLFGMRVTLDPKESKDA